MRPATPPFVCGQHPGVRRPDCQPCVVTRRNYDRWYNLHVLTNGPRLVDASDCAARIRDHLGHHWSPGHLVHLFGVTDSALRDVAAGTQGRITREHAERIMRLWPTFANAPDKALVPALPTIRRVQALYALGYTRRQHIDPMVPSTNVSYVLRARQVHLRTHRDVAAGYKALAGTPGPSAVTRARAATAGYLPPAAWDDIDNLYALPVA